MQRDKKPLRNLFTTDSLISLSTLRKYRDLTTYESSEGQERLPSIMTDSFISLSTSRKYRDLTAYESSEGRKDFLQITLFYIIYPLI